MRFIGGSLQQQYVERTRALDPSRCLAAGIDVGKFEALGEHRTLVRGEQGLKPHTVARRGAVTPRYSQHGPLSYTPSQTRTNRKRCPAGEWAFP